MPERDDIPRAGPTAKIILSAVVFLLALVAGGGIRLVHEVAVRHPLARGAFWAAIAALAWAIWRGWRRVRRPASSSERPARTALMEAVRQAERQGRPDKAGTSAPPTSQAAEASEPASAQEPPHESGDSR